MIVEWLPGARIRHTQWMIGLTPLFLLLGGRFCILPFSYQVLLLVLAVSFLGVPHGALDYQLGRHVFRERWEGLWPLPFLIVYLFIMGLVLWGWKTIPVVTVGGFLVASCFHFGSEDVGSTTTWTGPRWLEVLIRGGLPIVLAIGLHPISTAKIFAILLPSVAKESISIATSLASKVVPIWLLGCSILVLAYMKMWMTTRNKIYAWTGLEILALLSLFVLLPPLLAFVLYFCGWHSIRHTLVLASRSEPHRIGKAILQFGKLATPLTLLTLLAAAGAGVWLKGQLGLSEVGVQVVFYGLSALTFPHMLFSVWAKASSDLSVSSPLGFPHQAATP